MWKSNRILAFILGIGVPTFFGVVVASITAMSGNILERIQFSSMSTFTIIQFALFVGAMGASLISAGWLINERSRIARRADELQRALNSKLELSERRIEKQFRRELDTQIGQIVSSDEIVSRLLDQKLSDGIIEATDKALAARTGPEAKRIRLQRFLDDVSDRLRIKYDGPAGRAEDSATIARRFSYCLAMFGLVLAACRVFLSGGFNETLIRLIDGGKGEHFWPLIFAQAAPWVGLIVLIEFTALIFFRFYLRSIELQRYFTKELANSENRFGALRIITELGSDEQAVKAAFDFMKVNENNLRSDETDALPKNVSVFADAASKLKDFVPGKGA